LRAASAKQFRPGQKLHVNFQADDDGVGRRSRFLHKDRVLCWTRSTLGCHKVLLPFTLGRQESRGEGENSVSSPVLTRS
jgi:hypothetical protein